MEPVELVQNLEEVTRLPGDSVRGPDQHDVEAAAAGVAHQVFESGPACLDAGDLVGKLGHDFVAALGSHLAQVEQLTLRVLIDARHPGVDGGALHKRRPVGFGEYFAT